MCTKIGLRDLSQRLIADTADRDHKFYHFCVARREKGAACYPRPLHPSSGHRLSGVARDPLRVSPGGAMAVYVDEARYHFGRMGEGRRVCRSPII